MRDVPLTIALPLALAAAAAPAFGSDLKLDGQTSVTKTLGSTLQVELTGGLLLPAAVAVDVSPGPVFLFNESIPIGLTPSFQVVASFFTDFFGKYSPALPIPLNPGLAGNTFYMVGVVVDPADPNGLDISGGADFTIHPIGTGGFVQTELAGNPLAIGFPEFEWVTTFNEGTRVAVGVDTSAFPGLIGQTVDIYVTDSKTAGQWDLDASLTDVSGDGANTVALSPTAGLNWSYADTGTLGSSLPLPRIGQPYDVVVDVNQNGVLDAGDLIDGYGAKSGLYVVGDVANPGPYATTEILYSGGTWLGQDLYYPSNIDSLGQLPLVIISHGNGHNYQWYDHIGRHLTSYGYIVMSHQNNTGPGIQSASHTTLTNTDYILGNLGSIGGGVLNGHVDSSQIVWIGHSRGGEGVARAYDKILDGVYNPANFSASDIKLIISMAPTDFLGTSSATPHDKPYVMVAGIADADVNGCANNNIAQYYHLLGRAEDQRQCLAVYGVGHAWWHDGGGSAVASGPCLLNEDKAHRIQLGYFLPLLEFHIFGNPAGKDFLWRPWEEFHPIGAPSSDPCAVVNLQYRDAASTGRFAIDDFQDFQPDAAAPGPGTPTVASSGAAIAHTLSEWREGRYDDQDFSFTWLVSDPFNGFTYSNASDPENGGVLAFDGSGDKSLSYDMLPADEDWSSFGYLTFRACQTTRHPLTTAQLADLDFEVRLVDGDGTASVIRIGNLGAGIEEPYQRTGCGTGAPGWANEFEVVRIDLRQFTVNTPDLDLSSIDKLEFLFGPSHGATQGRIGIDDIALEVD